MRTWTFVFGAFAGMLIACGPSPSENSPGPVNTGGGGQTSTGGGGGEGGGGGAPGPSAQDVPCRLPLADDAVAAGARCVDVIVPQRRGDALSPEATIHAALFAPDAPGTPVFVLNGGPGLRGESWLPWLDQETLVSRFGKRPVVYLEQRGVGPSTPTLSCSGSLPGCAAKARDNGVLLEHFGAVDTADDVADMAQALGYAKIFVAGGSWASRVGLEVLRRHPDRVAGAVFESLVPPDEAYLNAFVTGTDAALTGLFAACAKDPACAAQHPDLEATFSAAFAAAEATPVATQYGPANGVLLTYAILESQYHQDFLAAIPAGLAAVAANDAAAVKGFIETALSRPPALERLKNQVALCVDVAPLFDAAVYDAAVQSVRAPLRAVLTAIGQSLASCSALEIKGGSAESRLPVTFAGPVLLLAGELDARTPPSNAERVKTTLPAAQLVVLRQRTHTPALGFQYAGTFRDPCAESILRSFLDSPGDAPDTGCLITPLLAWP